MIHASPQLAGLAALEHEGEAFAPADIRLTGMRWLVEYRSAKGRTLWGDLPHSHGLYLPLLIDPANGQIRGDTTMRWWAEPMMELVRQPKRDDSVVKVERRRRAERYVVLNALDYVFGHSLLLLLNAQHYLDHHADHGLIIVCTREMRPFLPEGVAEVWELQTSLPDTRLWHRPLEELFAERCREAPCAVATGVSHPSPGRYRLERFNLQPGTGPANLEAPRIIFIYRGDRLWGGSFVSERKRLQRLAQVLVAMWPKARLEIHGHAPLPEPVAGWRDDTRRGGGDYDTALLAALRDADLVLGAHGSSMLLPTAIARLVIELVPLGKQASLLQDSLFNAGRWSLREHFWRLRFLYGNGTMNDISPRSVAQLINDMISVEPHFALYQGQRWEDPEMDGGIRAQEGARIMPRLIEQWLERRNRSLTLPPDIRFWQWARRQAGERD